MKKNVIAGVMLATAAIFGTSASFAQAPTTNDANGKCAKGEKCDAQRGPKCDKACANPFEGLNLTADQQTKLDALKAECQAKKAEMKKDVKVKKDQLKKDAKEGRTNMKSEMLQKVKAILTPEQYVQFLENSFVNNGGQGHKQGMKKDMRKCDKQRGDKGGKGQKPEKK